MPTDSEEESSEEESGSSSEEEELPQRPVAAAAPRRRKDEDEPDPAQMAKDMERLALIRKKRCARGVQAAVLAVAACAAAPPQPALRRRPARRGGFRGCTVRLMHASLLHRHQLVYLGPPPLCCAARRTGSSASSRRALTATRRPRRPTSGAGRALLPSHARQAGAAGGRLGRQPGGRAALDGLVQAPDEQGCSLASC